MDKEQLTQNAALLLDIIWRGVPADYKSRYRMTIWQQYEDEVRSAAYTSNLGRFISSLCLRLNASIGRDAEDRERAESLLRAGLDRALLRLMREETTLLVLMVRVWQQERREEWRQRQESLQSDIESEEINDAHLLI